MQRPAIRFFTPVFVTVAIATVVWVNAGQLDPPAGPISPTDRSTISQEDIPLVIIEAGSYRLIGNLEAQGAGQNCITIAANDVTLDLNGFLIGPSEVFQFAFGVTTSGTRQNITVKNGTIRSCTAHGVFLVDSTNNRLSDLRLMDNVGSGMRVGNNSIITNCTAFSNGSSGISTAAGEGTVVRGCTATDNGTVGILVGSGGTVIGCSCKDNDIGIQTIFGSTVSQCSAYSNTTVGIDVGDGSTVSDCTASSNTTGIQVADRCRVVGNTCASNSGAGILTDNDGDFNRIEGNHVSGNGTGIDVDGVNNFVVKNTAIANTTAYAVVAGNHLAQIVSNPGMFFTSTNPWANFLD